MADVKVTCITKRDPGNRHEHITHIGGNTWKWDRDKVIESIDAGTNTFYVIDPSTAKRSEVGVVRPKDGRSPYLRTHADGDWNDNLLSLKQCE